MKYLNANIVLPEFLVEELQKYVQGDYLYIPRKKGQRRQWGELSGGRQEIAIRNQDIVDKYNRGASIENLAEGYYLSSYAIKKIIYKK